VRRRGGQRAGRERKGRKVPLGNEKKDLDWAGDNQLTSLNLSKRVRVLTRSGCRLLRVEGEELLEGGWVAGFQEVQVAAGLEAGLHFVRLAEAGHRDQQRLLQARQVAEPAGNFVPVHVRHADVQENDVGANRGRYGQRGGPVGCLFSMVAPCPQQRALCGSGVVVVFNDENSQHGRRNHEKG
jgi:hypothetical protein